MILRRLSIRVGRAQRAWLTLLLLLAVTVPSVCLLWFMNQAVRNERLAVRQKLMDVYRGHLTLAGERLDEYWRHYAERLEQLENLPSHALFAKVVQTGLADAAICFDANGRSVYPRIQPLHASEQSTTGWSEAQTLESSDLLAAAEAYGNLSQTTNANQAALALQAQARCLFQAGEKAKTWAVLTNLSANKTFRTAVDAQDRLISLNAGLMAIEIASTNETRSLVTNLESRLSDYNDFTMPAPQRRFLMRELTGLAGGRVHFPTLGAEELAARCLNAGVTNNRALVLSASSVPRIWQYSSADGRILALYRSENLPDRLKDALSLSALPEGTDLKFFEPGEDPEGVLLSIPASDSMPGWRLALATHDMQMFNVASKQRITTYIWTGALAVLIVIILAAFALGMVRRQAALTQLRNDLVANVTHELKTPLSSMRLLVDTLLDAPRINEQTAREYLQLIATENVRLSRLIENFLTFSRIERNKYAFDFQEVSANTIAEAAAAAVRDRFNAPGCNFETEIPDTLPRINADSDAMVTVLLNLLDNAYKYTGDAKTITLSACAENGSVVFKVRDNGIGLSPKDVKRVFKRFYQVDRHLARGSGGCGLGLSIVQFIVSAHGGTAEVESELGNGSVFSVTIPSRPNH